MVVSKWTHMHMLVTNVLDGALKHEDNTCIALFNMYIYRERLTAVCKVETDIIARIAARLVFNVMM
jgi:hypothetical protein